MGHALRNLTEGTGGPRDPSVLYDPDGIAREVGAVGLRVVRCEEVLRPVAAGDETRNAIDVLLTARPEPAAAS